MNSGHISSISAMNLMHVLANSTLYFFPFFFLVDPLKITHNPESKAVATGDPIAFTVEATGDNLQFKWQKDGNDIESTGSRLQCSQTKKTSTLRIQNVEKSDIGHYRCLVKNPVEKNGKTSHVAELTVCEFSS